MNAALPARIDDTLPVNLEIEQAVLGAVLINNDLVPALSFLRCEHFFEPIHRVIFEAVLARVADGRPATPVTLAGDIPSVPELGMTTAAYLAHIVATPWSIGEMIVKAAQELVLLAGLREIIGLGQMMTDRARAPGAKAAALIADAELRLMQLSEEIGQLSAMSREPSPAAILGAVRKRMDTGDRFKGARSGFTMMDEKLGGFGPGELIIIAGRPGMGKTALGVSLGRRCAHLGHGVAIDSIEMQKEAVWHRLVSDEALSTLRIPYKQIARGRLDEGEYEIVARAAEQVRSLPLKVLDRGNRLGDLPGHIRAARRWLAKRGKPLEVFILDYLGLIAPGDRYAGQKVNEVGEISATLKALAKRENVAIVALHQLSRANETRDEHRPRLSDLRDSGNLEQDADVVMFVYRDAYYIERPGFRKFEDEGAKFTAMEEAQNRLEVIIAKQRQGEIGTVRLWVDMATNAVRDEQ